MQRVLRFIFWSGVTILAGLMLVVLLIPSRVEEYLYSSVSEVPTTTVALVLGASVKSDGTLSPILRERADKGIELYKAGKVKKILVTGDNAEVSHNEVNPVGNYMLERGVPQEDIFLDHAGFDTYSSMYRARDVFLVDSVTIVSQPFHLPRAVLVARQLGLTAYGAEAGQGGEYSYNSLREIPATLKAIFDLFLSREPKFLGPTHPIWGDGSETWADDPLP